MNIPAILSIFRAIRDPPSSLPHATIPTFAQLPVPLSSAFKTSSPHSEKQSATAAVDIQGVVLDKDNCIAVANTETPYPAYTEKLQELVKTYSASNVLIVSNSSGLIETDPSGDSARRLEANTGLTVLRHMKRKPAPECGDEILEYFGKKGIKPHQIAVVGDRLFTDVALGNSMGAWTIWVKVGVVPDTSFRTRAEYSWEGFCRRREYYARRPRPSS